jgi:uncharacterized Zn finger protein
MSRWEWEREWYPPSVPLEAKGGIRSQARSFGQKWWGRRWIAVLESFQIGGRLQRGRSYARKGQVLGIDVGKGIVTANVQGSRPEPYEVSIRIKPLKPEAWQRVAAEFSRQAVYAAKLLGGELPPEVEEVFHAARSSLFPERAGDLVTDCSCPDWSNPCKHIAAVYYLLGEEFDRDPFLIFKLRGMERAELLGAVKPARGPVEKPEPLPADPALFWQGGATPADLRSASEAPPVAAALVKRLGPLPFWRGEVKLIEALEPLYRAASERALE